jgi:UDP-N-acetyl-2-amino-2-deoxyglucuronate dehydrogenase
VTAPLRFALIGCGTIARLHVRALAEIPTTQLVALVGRTLDAPKRLVAELGLSDVSVHTHLADVLRRPDVDAVIVCTPSGDHLTPAIQAAEAGKHVVVEKPLEVTPERCDQIIAACHHAGVQLCTIFPSRFADASITLKAAIAEGRFGRLTLGETSCKWWRNQEYYDSAKWRGTWSLDGGGALMNQAIHNVDLLLWLMGPATHVTGATATLAHERIEVEDTAVATIRFANGALGTIIATTSAYPGLAKTMAIHGDRGSAVIEQDHVSVWQFADELPDDVSIRSRLSPRNGATGGAADPKAISHECHTRQLRDFVEAVRMGRKPAVDGQEGRKAVQLVCAIYEAARTGLSVALPTSRSEQ